MNPESPTPREQLEARLTALLLGELSGDEAAALREIIAHDAQFAALHARLKETIGLVREAALDPAELAGEKPAPVRLGEERRQKMLAQFKTVTPPQFAPAKPPRSLLVFALECAAVVAILVCLSGLLLPALSRSKAKAQGASVVSNLRQLEMAKQMWAADNRKGPDATPTKEDILLYLGRGSSGELPTSPLGERYIIGRVGESPRAELDANKATKFGGSMFVTLPSKDAGKKEIALAGQVQQLAESRAVREYPIAPQPNDMEPATAAPPLPVPEAAPPTVPSQQTIVLPPATPVEVAATDTDKMPGLASSQDGDNRKLLVERRQEEATQDQLSKDKSDGLAVQMQLSRPRGVDSNGRADLKNADTPLAWSPGQNRGATGNWGLADGSVQKGSTGTFHTYIQNPGTASPPQTMAFGNDLGLQPAQSQLGGLASSAGSQAAAAAPSTAPIVMFQNTGATGLGAAGGFGGGGGGGSFARSPESGKPSTLARMVAAPKQETAAGSAEAFTPATPASLTQPAAASATAAASSFDNSGTLGAVDGSVRLQNANPPEITQGLKGPTAQSPLMLRSQTVQQNMTGQTATHDAETHDIIVVTDSGRAATSYSIGQLETAPAAPHPQNGFINGPNPGQPVPQIAPPPSSDRNLMYTDTGFKFAGQNDSRAGKPANVVGVGMIVGANAAAAEDQPLPKPAVPAPVPQPEVLVSENAFSTFSLNVSDVSFKLAAASLERGVMPDAASIRSEEFINAFDYRDPDPAPGAPIGFAWERARDPFAHNRDFLRFSVKTAAAGRQPGRPLNLVLLLDNSGSMERADRVAIIHEALRVLAAQLQSQDTISVVTFARTARLWVDGIRGPQAGQVLETVGGLTPEGGTDLGDALDLAYATAHRHYLANGANRVVLLTDGAANLGNVDPATLKASVEAQRKQGIALDCFGIGWEGYNDDLLEVLTRNGDGRYEFINTPEEAASGFAAQLAGALHVAASDVKVQVEFNPARVISYRQIGYAKHQLTKEQFRDNSVNAAQIGAAEAGNGLYTVEINPQGTGPVCTVHVRYRDPGTANYNERAWDVPYTGGAVALDQASPAMRLAAAAGAFSEWLASSPYAGEVSPDALLNDLRGVPAVYGADTRPAQLETMIREAKSVTGK